MPERLNLRAMPPNSSRMVEVVNVDKGSSIWMSAHDAQNLGLRLPTETVILDVFNLEFSAEEALQLYTAWKRDAPAAPAVHRVRRAVVARLHDQLVDLDLIDEDD